MGMFSSFGNEPQPVGMMQNFIGEGSQPQPIGMMQNFIGEGSQPQPVPMIKGLQQPGIAPRIGYTQPLPTPRLQQPVAGPVAPAVEPIRQFEQYQPYFQQMRQNVTGLEEALKQFEQTMLPGQPGQSNNVKITPMGGGIGNPGKISIPGMF